MELTPFISFINLLADASGTIINRYFRAAFSYDRKEDASPVTIVDQEVERRLRELIEEHFPTHGIIGEEYGTVRENSPWCWMIDPIDGTKAFMIGRPLFGTLIALLYNDIPVLGVIDQPHMRERWVGSLQYGTTYNGTPAATSKTHTPSQALFCTTAPELFAAHEQPIFRKVQSHTQYTIYGGDCYNYASLASGWVDIVMESQLKPHDFCALAPIIIGAGGKCTDWKGQTLTRHSAGDVLASANDSLHHSLLTLISDT